MDEQKVDKKPNKTFTIENLTQTKLNVATSKGMLYFEPREVKTLKIQEYSDELLMYSERHLILINK